MSKGLENLTPFIEPVTGDYPWGDIKDGTGVGDGTDVNRSNHADYHQTFRKLLSLANITPNGLPDNVTNGYQYIDAMKKVLRTYIGAITLSADATELLSASDIGYFINAEGNTINKRINLPSAATLQDGDMVTIYNNSNSQIEIRRGVLADNINGSINIYLDFNGDYVTLVLDKPNLKWYIANYKGTVVPPPPSPVISTHTTVVTNATFTFATLLFPNEIADLGGQFNTTTGKFKANVVGQYQVNFTGYLVSNVGDYSAEPAGGLEVRVSLYKNATPTSIYSSIIYRGKAGIITPCFASLIDITSTSDEYTIVLTTSNICNIEYGGTITYNLLK